MIKELKISNFKCFQEVSLFEFSKINLLTGINGRGKSTLLQTLLLISQSIKKDETLQKLFFNDFLIDLGNYDDVKNSEIPRGENILFGFKFDSLEISSIEFNFSEDLDDPLKAQRIKMEIDDSENLVKEKLNVFKSFIEKIHFVSANRLGPVKYVDKFSLPNFINVGSRGEHTINILANSINLDSVNDVLYRGNDSDSLIQQTIEWLSYILEGATIEIKGKEKESSVLYMLLNNKTNSFSYKPNNVGFGYSYVLPLIVTGLLAKEGEIIIIENPEAHLHPRAQSRVSEFFVKVASCGIQVFIESHSEHILNGLRVGALKPDIAVNNDELIIHYFNENFQSEKLTINDKGKIINWPSGFFDQQEIDLANIFKFSQ